MPASPRHPAENRNRSELNLQWFLFSTHRHVIAGQVEDNNAAAASYG
jgi:hypothetical protein